MAFKRPRILVIIDTPPSPIAPAKPDWHLIGGRGACPYPPGSVAAAGGILLRTASQIEDVPDADLWVMDRETQYFDEGKALTDNALYRVRGVSGVRWAVPLYKGIARALAPDGKFRQVVLLGIDDASLVGAPRKMLLGRYQDLKDPDAVIIDRAGYAYFFPAGRSPSARPSSSTTTRRHRGGAGVPRRTAVAAAEELVAELGLAKRAHALPVQLSGGQQQRVAIARALIHEPHLVLCDKPTAALDRDHRLAVMRLLAESARREDRAVIVVTHDNRIMDFADRIASWRRV